MTDTITTAEPSGSATLDPWGSEFGRLTSPDAAVIRLAEQAIELWRSIPGMETDAEINPTADKLDSITERLMQLPAWTPAGILAKQRLYAEMLPRWSGAGWNDDMEGASRSILADLMRLAGEGAGAVPTRAASNLDARLLELYGEVRKILDADSRGLSDEQMDERSGDATKLEFAIAEIPAHTPAGLLAKAMIAADNIWPSETPTSDEANLFSLIADLRRLAGETAQ